MSATAAWVYTNIADVRPFISYDSESGESVYGDAFEIMCTWTAEHKVFIDAGASAAGIRGEEFVSELLVYTEDPRPKYGDMITPRIPGFPERKIRSHKIDDMSFFGEEPDYILVT